MASLTLTIADDLLHRAQIRAQEQGTSVDQVVRRWLEHYAGDDRQRDATEAILEIGDRANASSGSTGRTWAKDDAYSSRVERRAG